MGKENLIFLGITSAILSVIGALTGLGLSFTALSPLVIGGIIAAIPAMLLSACITCGKGEFSKKDPFISTCLCFCLCFTSAAIGVGFAAAATAIFPGAMIGMGSAALAGAAIGVIAPIVAICIIALIAEKVGEYINSPTVECFSSKKQEV